MDVNNACDFPKLNFFFEFQSAVCGGVACHKCWQQFLKFHSWNYYANAAAAHMYLKKSLEPQLFQGLFFKSEVYLDIVLHISIFFIFIYIAKQGKMDVLDVSWRILFTGNMAKQFPF